MSEEKLLEIAREERNRYKREWCAKNREHVNAYNREYRKKNKERLKQKERERWIRKAKEIAERKNIPSTAE